MDNSGRGCINGGVKQQPSLKTSRLVLRLLMAKDTLAVRDLVNSPEIVHMSLWIPRGRGADGVVAGGVGQAGAGLTRAEKGLLGYRLLIDNGSEDGVVCQNGTLQRPLRNTVTPPYPHLTPTLPPPYPHRIPTVPPPYRKSDPECAILAQFGVSEALQSWW